jgi:clan AA aspartic protease (TIGR02281 family)
MIGPPYRRLCASLGLLFLLALTACQTGGASDGQPCTLGFLGSLKLTPSAGHLALDATINAIPVRFWLDTGSFSTLLRNEDGARLGLKPTDIFMPPVLGMGGGQPMRVERAHTIDVGRVHGEAFPLGLIHLPLPQDIDGLLGMDYFSRIDLDLDLPAARLNLYQPRHDCSRPSAFMHGDLISTPLLDAKPGQAYSAASAVSQPRITVVINGVALRVLLDTGAPQNVLFADGASKLGITSQTTRGDPVVRTGGIGSTNLHAPLHRMPPIEIGTLDLDNIRAVVVPALEPNADLLLGLDFFRNIHVWISHSSGTVILQYPPQPSPLNPAALSAPAAAR